MTRAPSARLQAVARRCKAPRDLFGHSTAPALPSAQRAGSIDEDPPGPPRQRLRSKSSAIRSGARQTDKKVSRPRLAGVDDDPLRAGLPGPSWNNRGPRRPRSVVRSSSSSSERRAASAPPVPRWRRRRGSYVRPRTPDPARGPCLRSPRHPLAPRPRSRCDGLTAVDGVLDPWPGAGEDLRDDRLRVLRARIVRGDQDVVGQPRCNLAHQWALAAVAVAAAPNTTWSRPSPVISLAAR